MADRWAAACRACWLGDGRRAPAPAAVGEVLEVLAALAPDLRSRPTSATASPPWRPTRRGSPPAWRRSPRRWASTPGGRDPAAALATDAVLGRRIAEARAARAAREACGRGSPRPGRAGPGPRRRGGEPGARRRAAGLLRRRHPGRGGGAAGALRRARPPAGEAAGLERDIRAALRVADIAAAEARLDGLDVAALEAERDAAAGRYEAADLDLRSHHASRVTAQAALDAVGGDDAVARIETRRRAVLLDIEDQARRFIKLKGGIAAAELALAAYRDRHRSALLAKASAAFATISRGAYTGLAAQPTDKGEVLIARAGEGATKQAGDLRKGTRFQLYLALRAAGYHEFAATRRAVPFVADDIMETFDDFRAEEAFRLFAGMAEVGQVIYLTHHRHLIDIARTVCPDVTVHRLDDTA